MKNNPLSDQETVTSPPPWRREPFVWMLIVIPLAAVIAGFYTLYLAIESDDGLVADDYYQRGKEINRVLIRDQAAVNKGMQARIELHHNNANIVVRLTANSSYQLPPQIQLQLLHSTRAGLDRTLNVVRMPNGQYETSLPKLSLGHWYLQLEADDWRLTGSLQIQESVEPTTQPQTILLQAG